MLVESRRRRDPETGAGCNEVTRTGHPAGDAGKAATALLVGLLAVGFEAHDPVSELPLLADLTAEQPFCRRQRLTLSRRSGRPKAPATPAPYICSSLEGAYGRRHCVTHCAASISVQNFSPFRIVSGLVTTLAISPGSPRSDRNASAESPIAIGSGRTSQAKL